MFSINRRIYIYRVISIYKLVEKDWKKYFKLIITSLELKHKCELIVLLKPSNTIKNYFTIYFSILVSNF